MFKTFYVILKAVIESKDYDYATWGRIHCVKYLCLWQNGLLSFKFGYKATTENQTLSSFSPANTHW